MAPDLAVALPAGSFIGLETLRARLCAGLTAAAGAGWHELILCDADFRDWRLGQREVVASLQTWMRGGARRLTLLARSYDELPRRHARFVEWRRLWAHRIECRQCRAADAHDLPSGLWYPAWALQCINPQLGSGLCGADPAQRAGLRQQIDGWLARSTPGFPAHPPGL